MLIKKFCICALAALNLFCLTGCQNNEVSDSAELSGNIALSQYDTALRLNKIATNVTSSESGFSSTIIKMIQSTTTVSDTDYETLKLTIDSALNTIDTNLNLIDEFTCPATMTEKRDNVRTAIVLYQDALKYIQTACTEKSIDKLKAGYSQYISAISSIQAATANLN